MPRLGQIEKLAEQTCTQVEKDFHTIPVELSVNRQHDMAEAEPTSFGAGWLEVSHHRQWHEQHFFV